MRKELYVGCLIAALMVVGLSGCAAGTPDSATPALGDSAPTDASLVTIAQDYVDCMNGAGIPMTVVSNGSQLVQAQFTGYDFWYVAREPSGDTYGGVQPDLTPDQEAQEDQASTTDQPGLVIDGVDRSEVFLSCLDRSGYTDQGARSRTTAPGGSSRSQIEANLRWERCAQENGFKDILVIESDTAFVPSTMDPDDLRALLQVCPTVGLTSQERLDGEANPLVPDSVSTPNVSLDRYSLDGLSQADIDRMTELYEILGQSQQHQATGQG